MFEFLFYETKLGDIPIVEYLDGLQQKSLTNKAAGSQRKIILAYMAALAEKGANHEKGKILQRIH